MRVRSRGLLAGFLLTPVVLWLSVLLYVPTRFTAPPEGKRLQVLGEPAAAELKLPCDVLVWNIYKGERSGFPTDLRALADGGDLVLLQEFHANDRVQQALKELSDFSFQLATSFLYRSDLSATGVMTGAVAPAVESECFISSDREPVSGTPKATLVCRYRLDGIPDELLVVNIHAINVVGLSAFQNQLEQVRETLEAHNGPIVFAGDFNTNIASKQEFLRAFMAEFGLTEMQFASDDRTTTPLLEIPIDYVFTRGLVTSRSTVAGDRDGSDHKAMTFRIDGLRR